MLELYVPKNFSKISSDKLKPPRYELNRRSTSRIDVSQLCLRIAHETDIFIISNLSKDGFCAMVVAERARDKFKEEGIYPCLLRHRNQKHKVKVKVIWKKEDSVGFVFEKPSDDFLELLQEFLRKF